MAGSAWKLWALTAWRFVRSAPLTYVWLLVLLYTTIVAHSVSAQHLHRLLLRRSTNLHHLNSDPLYVLFTSLAWIDGRYWLPYLVLFSVFVAPAERWLGKLRWLGIGLTAHIGATYISEGLLAWAIDRAVVPTRLDRSLENVRDIGVSYFLVGIVGVLSYRIARPWRWGYLAVAVSVFVVALIVQPGFTPVGHLSALLIALGCYPLIRGRDHAQWDPGQQALVRRLRTTGAGRWRPGARTAAPGSTTTTGSKTATQRHSPNSQSRAGPMRR